MSKPFVTVLIDTHNHASFIEEAVVSVLEQDFPRDAMEILVVDDGSTDATPEIVRKFEPRLRLLRKPNGGQASAFNFALREASGEIVAFLDGDDWWARNKLTIGAGVFDREPEVGFIGHGNIMVPPNGREWLEVLREGCRFRVRTPQDAILFRNRKHFMGTSRMMIRTHVLRQIGAVPAALRIQADEYIFTLAAVLTDVRILPDALFYYRLHDANAFMIDCFDPQRIRVKHFVLDALTRILESTLQTMRVDRKIRRIITEPIRAEADHLRLTVDAGYPWETIWNELQCMRILHPEATYWQRVFSLVRLVPAAVLPSRTYHQWKLSLSRVNVYQRLRRRFFPFPVPSHVPPDQEHAR